MSGGRSAQRRGDSGKERRESLSLKELSDRRLVVDISERPLLLSPENGKPDPVFKGSNTTLAFPLHEAARKGNLEQLKIVLKGPRGNPFQLDFKQRTALHYAANYGNQTTALVMVNEILGSSSIVGGNTDNDEKAVKTRRSQLLQIQDEMGETALHLAAKNGHRKVVQLFLNCGVDVNTKSKDGVEPIELIYAKVPLAMCAIFDTAIMIHSGEIADDSFEVLLDFGPIVGYPDESEQEDPFLMESELLACALKQSENKCKEILVHPLVRLFIHFKWGKVRPLFWTSIAAHIFWLLVVSQFLLDLYLHTCPYLLEDKVEGESETQTFGEDASQPQLESENATLFYDVECHRKNVDVTWAILTTAVSFIVMLKEMYESISVPTISYYFKRLENWGQWLLIIIVALTTLPVWVHLLKSDSSDQIIIRAWQYQCAALGVFLAWTLILFQIGKTPILGIYVEILLRVLKSFGLFVLTFTSLLTAFALSFSIIMPQNKAFSSWPLALSKVLMMMVGELNYDDIFYADGEDEIPFKASAHIIFVIFTVIVTIILFNLLIGLTVSDIQGLQAGANVSLLASQLEQIYLMESFLFSKHMKRFFKIFRLNPNFMRRFQISAIEEDEMFGVIIPTRLIPKALQVEVKELVAQNLSGGSSLQLHEEEAEGSGHKGTLNLTKEELKSLINEAVAEFVSRNEAEQKEINV